MELLKSLPGSEVVVQLRDFIVYPAKRSMRIFMSYAGHGCLEGIRDLYPAASIRLVLGPIGRAGGAARQHKYVPEAAVWSLLEQLNRARILMEYGSTDDDNRPENWDQIVHRGMLPSFVCGHSLIRYYQTSNLRISSSMRQRRGRRILAQYS